VFPLVVTAVVVAAAAKVFGRVEQARAEGAASQGRSDVRAA